MSALPLLYFVAWAISICVAGAPDEKGLILGAVIGLSMVAYGGSFAVMYTIIMDKSDPASAATDFTLQMSISGISAFAAIGLAMRLA